MNVLVQAILRLSYKVPELLVVNLNVAAHMMGGLGMQTCNAASRCAAMGGCRPHLEI